MKRFFVFVALAGAMLLASCSEFDDSRIWDKLDNHESRISQLEELCKQMNTNISSLQTIVNALQENDYITNVSPVRKDGEVVGYTITFAHSDTITIYHGEDGKNGENGADGKDGYTPQIGVMKDIDDIYYWTVDGEWLLDGKGNKIKAVGQDGKDGTDGEDGKDGTNGTNGSNGVDGEDGKDGVDGKDGADGITPRLKIEDDYWYISYDEGKSWEQLGKATGEDGADGSDGADGNDGADGDSIFKSVTQDDEYVYFNLADGTMITLPKHDSENIQFEDLNVKAICCKHWDTNYDGELSYAEAAAVTDIGTVFKGNENIVAITELRYFTEITEIPDEAFAGCIALWKLILPKTITTIGDRAFDDCGLLCNVTIPDSVTSIGEYAFSGCISLTNIVIPDSVTAIGDFAFYNCSSLKNVQLGEGLTNIGPGCFCDCDNLEIVKCNAQTPPQLKKLNIVTTLGDGASYYLFSNKYNTSYSYYCTEIRNSNSLRVYVDNSVLDLYKNDACWSIYANLIQGEYKPIECISLTITANNVEWYTTSTTIYYTAVVNAISNIDNKQLATITINGMVQSDEFEQNMSNTDIVVRNISYTYLGVAASTTITQGKCDKSYTINLNDQWRLSETVRNPDSSIYEGVYESYSNYHQNYKSATMHIDINGYSEFSIYVRSYAEDTDYVVVYNIDSVSSKKMTTEDDPQSGTSIGSYTKVTFSDLDYGSHRITISYVKDSSAHYDDDRGYVLIPIKQ